MYEPKTFIKVFKKVSKVLSSKSELNRHVVGNALAKLTNAFDDVILVLHHHKVDIDNADEVAAFIGAEAYKMYLETPSIIEGAKERLTQN